MNATRIPMIVNLLRYGNETGILNVLCFCFIILKVPSRIEWHLAQQTWQKYKIIFIN